MSGIADNPQSKSTTNHAIAFAPCPRRDSDLGRRILLPGFEKRGESTTEFFGLLRGGEVTSVFKDSTPHILANLRQLAKRVVPHAECPT